MSPDKEASAKRVMDSLLEKYSAVEIRQAFSLFAEKKLEWADTIQENLEVFPLSFDEVKALTATKTISWLHPLTQISHALLEHFNVIDEPLMLHSNEVADSGKVRRSGCHCFYATVTYDDAGITVYDNMGMGGMCPEEPQFVRAYLPMPVWMAPHLQALHEMASKAMDGKALEYDKPIANYTWPTRQPVKAPDPQEAFAP